MWWRFGPYGGMGYDGGMVWMMLMGGTFWLFLLVLAVAAIVWLVRGSWQGGPDRKDRERSSRGLEIAEERYAKGEITREEYLQMKRDLSGRGA